MDPAAIVRLLDALQAGGHETHSLMVLRHGSVIAEGWWQPYQPSGLHLLYSLSKSFTSTAVGIAVSEGLLSVDDAVTSFFPESVSQDVHPYVAQMQVRHLLSMASGHHEDTLDRLDPADPVRSFLALAPEEEPGTWFTYNNGATMMLSAILTRLTGQRLLDYIRPRLLEPLGVPDAYWQTLAERAGQAPGTGTIDLGFSGLHLSTEDIASFGQLYLQQGRWLGRQLLPQEWVQEATRFHVDNPREPNPDWRQGYGYQFWMGQHGYRGDGAFGQFCVVLPDQDTVVAMTSATEDMQGVLDCIWSELLPALSGHSTPEDSGEAQQQLAGLTLATGVGTQATPSEVTLPWSSPTDTGSSVAPALLSVTGIEEAPGGWRLTLSDPAGSYVIDCGHDHWARSETQVSTGAVLQVATSGGWTADEAFRAELAFVQTPHRLTLDVDLTDGSTTARWNAAPLGVSSISGLALHRDRA